MLLIGVEFINDLFVCQQHPPATVSRKTEIVEDLLGILACCPPLLELFIRC